MSIPSNFPTFSSLHPPKLLNFHFPSLNLQAHYFHHRHYHRRRLLPVIRASVRKLRASSRKVRSNADVCNDIREFMCVVGLPDDHVPTSKELSDHGRQDLANIVRRRGYKLIRELLATSIKTEINASDDEILTEVQDKASATEEKFNESQDEKVNGLDENVTLPSEATTSEEHPRSVHIDINSTSSFEESIVNKDSTEPLLEKAANFIRNGELEVVEDILYDASNENVGEVEKRNSESSIPVEPLSSVSNKESSEITLSSQSVGPSTFDNDHLRKDNSSKSQFVSASNDKELDVEAGSTEDPIEVNRLKFMLHQKELELSHLKQQIEKEKQVLSNLQSKVETEISKAQNLILDKDAELQAAEETLSGLYEVLIEYQGVGLNVEVAGSFNGWHQPVKLDPQPSSIITDDPVGLRDTKLWRSTLWLYPGVYQIKFIVDGQWRVDPERESISIGGIQNNILRVGR